MRRFYTGRYKHQPETKDATNRIYISFLGDVRIADHFDASGSAVGFSRLTPAFDSPGDFSFAFWGDFFRFAISLFVFCFSFCFLFPSVLFYFPLSVCLFAQLLSLFLLCLVVLVFSVFVCLCGFVWLLTRHNVTSPTPRDITSSCGCYSKDVGGSSHLRLESLLFPSSVSPSLGGSCLLVGVGGSRWCVVQDNAHHH